MQKEGQDRYLLHEVVKDCIPKAVLAKKNKHRSWEYGYNKEYDIVVISKTGQIGEVYKIEGLLIALPKKPTKCLQRHSDKKEQYWERHELPKELGRIKSNIPMESNAIKFQDQVG